MTRFQLRRFALQASRRPEWLPVLHDALHEHYGAEFEEALSHAQQLAKRMPHGNTVVLYSPNPKRSPNRLRRVFTVYSLHDTHLERTDPDNMARHFAREGYVMVAFIPSATWGL